jgi:hypothetical protein
MRFKEFKNITEVASISFLVGKEILKTNNDVWYWIK